MRLNPASRPPAEAGFVIIEVLVSALVILIVAGAVLSLITATTRSAADQRQKAAAYSVAQEDQARMRALRLGTLNRLDENNDVTLDGTTYTVNSTGTFIDNATGASSSCDAEGSESDYVRISSKVSWEGGRKSVALNSVVSPSNGSLDPNHGTLLVNATNGSGQPLAGLGLNRHRRRHLQRLDRRERLRQLLRPPRRQLHAEHRSARLRRRRRQRIALDDDGRRRPRRQAIGGTDVRPARRRRRDLQIPGRQQQHVPAREGRLDRRLQRTDDHRGEGLRLPRRDLGAQPRNQSGTPVPVQRSRHDLRRLLRNQPAAGRLGGARDRGRPGEGNDRRCRRSSCRR